MSVKSLAIQIWAFCLGAVTAQRAGRAQGSLPVHPHLTEEPS
jgi:hypothetical protein